MDGIGDDSPPPSDSGIVRSHSSTTINNTSDDSNNNAASSTAVGTFSTSSLPLQPPPPSQEVLHRHLTLLDLIAIGIGGTIGSGLFVLAGLVAHQYAGPATVVSWLLAGAAAGLSGCCYAELAARMPNTGGAYAWTRTALSDGAALMTATCLTMDYVGASAAVARSWGDKCVLWLQEELGPRHWIAQLLQPGGPDGWFNPLACAIATACVGLLLAGIKESKRATNFLTSLKVVVAIFMVVAGFCWTQPANWTSAPSFMPFGVTGVVRGATGTFFGFLGYDAVCCLGGEAMNPQRNLPVAILATLGSVTVLYVLATLALTGMQPSADISPVAGFPHAFYSLGHSWAGQFVAAGEILTLPIVVLITIMAQPRLMHAMSVDGLLPPLFRKVDNHGNLWHGTCIAGSIMVLVATFVPFVHLNDMISFAVLTILNLVDSSLLVLWHESPEHYPRLMTGLLGTYHAAALAATVVVRQLFLRHPDDQLWATTVLTLAIVTLVATALLLHACCPRAKVFGGSRWPRVAAAAASGVPPAHHHDDDDEGDDTDENHYSDTKTDYFRTPWLPFWPLLSIVVNWYLISQLEVRGVATMVFCLLLVSLYYFGLCFYRKNNDPHHQDRQQYAHYHHPGPIELVGIHQDNDDDGSERDLNESQNLATVVGHCNTLNDHDRGKGDDGPSVSLPALT